MTIATFGQVDQQPATDLWDRAANPPRVVFRPRHWQYQDAIFTTRDRRGVAGMCFSANGMVRVPVGSVVSMDRRRLLKTGGLGVLGLGLAGIFEPRRSEAQVSQAGDRKSAQRQASEKRSLEQARRAAVKRPRRVIFNDDGDDAWQGNRQLPPIEGFLDCRLNHIGNCGIDTVFYCTTQSINSYTHDSRLTEVFTTRQGDFANNRTAALINLGTDPLKLAIEACRRNRQEVFWTMRMNDWHDNFNSLLLSQWKKDHPEFLMAGRAEAAKFTGRDPRSIWTPADFAHREVRDTAVRTVRDVLDRYDVDGIDLDFLRARWYFQESRQQQPVTPEHLELLTEMVGRIRQEVLKASARKGKPILLSARTLPTADFARRFGTDVARWLELGFLDLLSVGGHFDPFTAMGKDLVHRGHALGIPVYLCVSGSDLLPRGKAHSDLSAGNADAWRGAAANSWNAGADGIMTFNLFSEEIGSRETARRIWQDVSDRELLSRKDKLFCVENVGYTKQHAFLVGQSVLTNALPVSLQRGAKTRLTMVVGDDIRGNREHVKSLRLRIGISGNDVEDEIEAMLNGHRLNLEIDKPSWLGVAVPAGSMRQGDNVIEIRHRSGPSGVVTLDALELTVRYQGVVQK